MKFTVRAGGEQRVAQVTRRGERLLVRVGDSAEADLRVLADRRGRFELEHGHARIHVAGVARGSERQVWTNGRTIAYTGEADEPVEPEKEGSLSSPLPAVVLEVLVQDGDEVSAGQRLVLLESMKTVLIIRAPRAGTVQHVRCRVGEAISAGVPLVEIAPRT